MSELERPKPSPATSPTPLFPDMHIASDIRVVYVQTPGGLSDPRVTQVAREIVDSQIEPVLHISFIARGQRHTALIGLAAIRKRGLPTDYPRLKAMFPDLEWSER